MAMTRAQVEESLALWSEREARYRKNWKGKRKGDPRRFFWFSQLRSAVQMVDERAAQLDALGVASVSQRGLDLVKEFEGFARTRPGKPDLAYPYKDPVGVWTIGFGETRGIGPSTKPWSRAKATERLRLRINRDYLTPVLDAAGDAGLTLSQTEADALASLVYNLGPGILAKGRTMGDALRSKNRTRIADAFLVYSNPNDPAIHAGLLRRRKAERALFLK